MKHRKTAVLLSLIAIAAQAPAVSMNVLPGYGPGSLPANLDGSTGQLDIGFGIDFYGNNYSQLYINNNGNLTFNGPMSTFVPFGITGATDPIIAPFFSDVDTRGTGSGIVTYGQNTFNGRPSFGATWNNVGYYDERTDLLNTFQVILVDRSDIGSGDFDIYLRYDQIEWDNSEWPNTYARVGFSSGDGTHYELPGSGIDGSFIDGGTNSLADTGIIMLPVRNGKVLVGKVVPLPAPFTGLVPFVNHADTPNGRSLAAALDRANRSGANSPLLKKLLEIKNPAALSEVLESLVPESCLIPVQIVLDSASRMHTMLGNSIISMPDTHTNVWVTPYSLYVDEDSQAGRPGFDYWTAGALAGFDVIAKTNTHAGLAIGFEHADYNADGRYGGNGKMDIFRAGPYVEKRINQLQLDASVLGGMHWNDIERRSACGKNDAQFHGYNISASGAMQYFIDLNNTFTLRPHARLVYAYTHEDSYKESGAEESALRFDSRGEDSLRSDIGLSLDLKAPVSESKTVTCSATAGYLHEFLFTEQEATASFIDTRNSVFGIMSDTSSDDSAYIGLAVNVPLTEKLLFDAGVNTILSSSTTQAGGAVRLTWLW